MFRSLRKRCIRRHQVGAVKTAWTHVEFGLSARGPDSARVCHYLVTERFARRHIQERRRQVRQVVSTSCGGVSRDVGSAGAVPEEGTPRTSVGLAIPYTEAFHLTGRQAVTAVIEHWGDQQLTQQGRSAASLAISAVDAASPPPALAPATSTLSVSMFSSSACSKTQVSLS